MNTEAERTWVDPTKVDTGVDVLSLLMIGSLFPTNNRIEGTSSLTSCGQACYPHKISAYEKIKFSMCLLLAFFTFCFFFCL